MIANPTNIFKHIKEKLNVPKKKIFLEKIIRNKKKIIRKSWSISWK